uniref:C2H2-type domain-containing protein n=1 Tax=Iconisemion striatum TaxID=60296 RepID=A0A1A7WF67_9TELE
MESSSFQSQLLSVMEVLAQAAVAEINRRVDDSCAVLRLELSQSRRDIELLKSKCEAMEAELRRSRRARRRVCNTPADETFSSSAEVLTIQSSDWDRQMESPNTHQQCSDSKLNTEAENVPIKEECAEEDAWRSDPQDTQISGAEQLPCFSATESTQTESLLESYRSSGNSADSCSNTLPEQQLSRNLNKAEFDVKHETEEEPRENAAPPSSVGTFVTEEANTQLWPTNPIRDDPCTSYASFGSQIRLQEDTMPKIHFVEKFHSGHLSSVRAKRRARTFGYRRPQTDQGSLSQINSMNSSSIFQRSQSQCRDETPLVENSKDSMVTNGTVSVFWQSHSSFGAARRVRMPQRSSLGEKRFTCTYCDKTFTRFGQLKEHMRSHTGERPFSCKQCGRSFTKQCNLIRHAVVHSGEKPHECSLCGKCFTQRSSLTSHQKTAH